MDDGSTKQSNNLTQNEGELDSWINSIPPDQYPNLFFKTVVIDNKPRHALEAILKHYGRSTFQKLFDKISQHYAFSLADQLLYDTPEGIPLYQSLIAQVNDQSVLSQSIIKQVNLSSKFSDAIRKSLVAHQYNQLNWELIYLVLMSMDSTQSLDLLVNTPLLESIAKENPDKFVQVMGLFKEPNEKFFCYTAQIPYALAANYSNDPRMNSTVNSISSIVSRLPGVGAQLQLQIESYQSLKPQTEPMLTRLVRTVPALNPKLPELLVELTPAQISALFRETDCNDKNLIYYLILKHELPTLLKLFASLACCIKNEARLLPPEQLNFDDYRMAVGTQPLKSGLVGFISLFSLYHYLCIKLTESKDYRFEARKNDFCEMLKYLYSRKMNMNIMEDLRGYIEGHPIASSLSIPLVMTSVNLGSTRYVRTRNKLLELQGPELIKGLALFKDFMDQRIQLKGEAGSVELDQWILKTVYTSQSSTKSLLSMK